MHDGKILLIRKSDKEVWELPGGIVKNKGDEETTAAEKTKAQIGVAPEIIQYFTVLEYQKDGHNTEATIFECDVPEDAVFRPGEGISDIKWFEKSKLSEENIGNDVKQILEEL
jgi:ADP-ribose pyrophosphatase YjhB (NUDIX family)